MTNIYDQHRAAFANVSAYVILDGAELVAKVAIKFPRDGASRDYAYVHFMGEPMVRGFAGGGGYDKRSAACADAACKLPLHLSNASYPDGTPHYTEAQKERFAAFRNLMTADDGHTWDRRLADFGFTVIQAV